MKLGVRRLRTLEDEARNGLEADAEQQGQQEAATYHALHFLIKGEKGPFVIERARKTLSSAFLVLFLGLGQSNE